MSFDAGSDYERCFLKFLLSKIVTKWVSLTFVDSSKNFLSGCIKNRSKLGFVMLTGLPGEEVASFLGYARL